MLNSKKDKSIKRYLARIGKLEHSSKVYCSRYYKLYYNEEISIIIRFSDHFSNRNNKIDIEIIKTSLNFYTIKTNCGITVTLTDETIIPYLKSLLIVYPDVCSPINSFKAASLYAEKELMNAKVKIAQFESKFKNETNKSFDTVLSEYKALINENKSLKSTIDIQKSQYSTLRSKYDKLLNNLSKLKVLRDQLNNIFK